MATDKYIVSRSNYSIKTKHKTVSNGTIYERDYMTTTQNGSFDGDVFPYTEGNFKMVRRLSSNSLRKHNFGEWLKQDVCVDGSNTGEYWTLNCISNDVSATTRSVEIKPNFNSMLDFVYYGSCEELVKSSINDILLNYPAELYFTSHPVYYYNAILDETKMLGYNFVDGINEANAYLKETGAAQLPSGLSRATVLLSGSTVLYEVSNPYEIDITRRYINTEKNPDANEMRYFCASANKYDILNAEDTMMACACDWEVLYKINGCRDGQLTGIILLNKNFNYTGSASKSFYLYEYYVNGRYFIMADHPYAGIKIRPTQSIISNFFERIDDFEKLLLNNKSTPLYTCTIDYPHDTERGIETYKKSFTWPTLYGWNLDIESNEYKLYVNGLLDLAEFYDEHNTDNLWGIMTHDAIKNMDLTYTRANSDEETEDYQLGTTRIEGLIRAYGRQFDEIKRTIDNIRSTNVVTYNQNNNTPDYFLSDSLELSGWEVYSSVNGLNTNTAFYAIDKKTYDASGNILTRSQTRKYGVNDTDVEFMRNLKLNSKAILSRKGTRTGIEYLLSLFGMQSYDFAKEYYNSSSEKKRLDFLRRYYKNATSAYTENDFDDFKNSSIAPGINYYELFDYTLDEYVYVASGGTTELTTSGQTHYPLSAETFNAYKINYSGNDEDTLSGLPCRKYTVEYSNGDVFSYIVPWFDKLSEYDGNPYFQMYGGWGKVYLKEINQSSLSSAKKIYSTQTATYSTTGKTQYALSEMSDGKYVTNIAKDQLYSYDMDSSVTGWKNIVIENVNRSDTIEMEAIRASTAVTVDSACVIITSYGLVYDVILPFSSVTIDIEDATVIVMEKGYSAVYVSHNYTYDKVIKGVNFYDESCKYIGIVRTLGDLADITLDRLTNGDIYYVYDVSGYENKYGKQIDVGASHYFIINDINFSAEYSENGWENIPLYDIEHGEKNGLKVLYLESIIDDNKGNAPHISKGKYDDGEEYLNYFRQIFYDSIKNDGFGDSVYNCNTGKLDSNINKLGFSLSLQKDNMKCWYFKDTLNSAYIEKLTDITETVSDKTFGDGIYEQTTDNDVVIGSGVTYHTTYGSDLIPYSFEPDKNDHSKRGAIYDENAANSIINTKKIKITFNGKYALNKLFRNYIMSSVIPYLKQIVPSTALLEISILGEESTLGDFEQIMAAGVAEDSYVLTKRYSAD